MLVRGVFPTLAQTLDTSETTVAQALEVQTVLGFSNTFRLGAWTPLTVIVTNHDQNLSAELQVQVTHGDELEDTVFTTTYHRSLELARNARKRIQFTVLLDNFSRPLVVRIVNPTPSAHGSEITRRTINLRRQFTEGHLVVVLARDADLDYLNDSTGDNVRVVYPHPELLPARWQAYDGVSAMVVHGYSLENLSARQYAALLKWISQGGRLVVSGGPDYSLLRTPRLAALLPGKPIGLASFANGAALSGVFSQSLAADRPFSVNQVTTTSGRTLYAADNIPLVIQTEHGLGRVFYFTFDIAAYPFDRWPGMTRLWLDAFNFDTAKRIQSKLDVAKKSPLNPDDRRSNPWLPKSRNSTHFCCHLSRYPGVGVSTTREPESWSVAALLGSVGCTAVVRTGCVFFVWAAALPGWCYRAHNLRHRNRSHEASTRT